MSSFKKEFKNQTQGMFIGLAFAAPFMLVVAVLLAYAKVPMHFNIIICVFVGFAVFFIFQLIYGMIRRKREEKRKNEKRKDPFKD